MTLICDPDLEAGMTVSKISQTTGQILLKHAKVTIVCTSIAY